MLRPRPSYSSNPLPAIPIYLSLDNPRLLLNAFLDLRSPVSRSTTYVQTERGYTCVGIPLLRPLGRPIILNNKFSPLLLYAVAYSKHVACQWLLPTYDCSYVRTPCLYNCTLVTGKFPLLGRVVLQTNWAARSDANPQGLSGSKFDPLMLTHYQ